MISVPAHFISTTKRGSQREPLLEAWFHFVQKRQVSAMGCSPHGANIGGDHGHPLQNPPAAPAFARFGAASQVLRDAKLLIHVGFRLHLISARQVGLWRLP
jgi:hypothetical protein